jgi:hypothetical protein
MLRACLAVMELVLHACCRPEVDEEVAPGAFEEASVPSAGGNVLLMVYVSAKP